MQEIFYFLDEQTNHIYEFEGVMPESENGLVFIGSSNNPNRKMAIAGLLQKERGFKRGGTR